MRRHLTTLLLGVLLTTGILAGCDLDDVTVSERAGSGGDSSERIALEEAREQWSQAGITSYDWSYDLACFCTGLAFDLEVREGREVTYDARDSGHGALPGGGDVSEQEPGPRTVEDLFDVITASLDNDADIAVEYDEETGRPLSLSVDPDETTYDDEFGYAVTAFTPRSS